MVELHTMELHIIFGMIIGSHWIYTPVLRVLFSVESITTDNSKQRFVVMDNNQLYSRRLVDGVTFDLTDNGLKVNDLYLTNQEIIFWKDNQFRSLSLGDGLVFNNSELSLNDTLFLLILIK